MIAINKIYLYQSSLQVMGRFTVNVLLYKAFWGSRGSCVKSVKLIQVMSYESASAGAKDDKSQDERKK